MFKIYKYSRHSRVSDTTGFFLFLQFLATDSIRLIRLPLITYTEMIHKKTSLLNCLSLLHDFQQNDLYDYIYIHTIYIVQTLSSNNFFSACLALRVFRWSFFVLNSSKLINFYIENLIYIHF